VVKKKESTLSDKTTGRSPSLSSSNVQYPEIRSARPTIVSRRDTQFTDLSVPPVRESQLHEPLIKSDDEANVQ